MEFWKQNTIWFDDLPKDDFGLIKYKENNKDISLLSKKAYIILWNYNTKNNTLCKLPANNSLQYLELNLSNCESVEGIKNFPHIKRLELHYCLKLVSDEGLSNVADSLEWLHINKSKKFKFANELIKLKKLKVLCLNDCGSIDNLDFLQYFPSLVDFRFVNTNIKNGDLTPILEHKSLINAGFLNKKHYNYNSETVKDILNKRNHAFRTPIYKGAFKTYKYDIFD